MTLRSILIGVAWLLLASAYPAMACTVPIPYDPNKILKQYQRTEIVRLPEVIVEGVLKELHPSERTGEIQDGVGFAIMHIDRVWKGELGVTAALIYRKGADCSRPPPFGKRIRIGARLMEKVLLLAPDTITLTPYRSELIETHDDFIFYSNRQSGLDLPLQDPELDRLIFEYRAQIRALKREADGGTREARLAFAAHLFENNERHRSLAAYEALLRDNPADLDLLLTLAIVRAQLSPDDEPEATLAEVERKAPRTPEWQRKIAHARFVATGRLTPGWKDWSDLKPARHCEVSEGNFDDATFDSASLATCEFVRSSFRNASFLNADLTDAYFEDTDLAGAKYDCATRLPEDLDPVAAGMVNVEGSCAKP